jgi:hypothetical protein
VNLTRDDLEGLNKDDQEKIRTAALSWLNESSVFADGIAVGLACGWDEFFDLALQELSHERRIFSSSSTINDVLSDMDHKAKIVEVLHKYPVEMNTDRISSLKEVIQRTEHEGLKNMLLEFLAGQESEAVNGE